MTRSFSVGGLIKCSEMVSGKEVLLQALCYIIGFSFLIDLGFLTALAKYLKGARKMYLIIQQSCIILYLALLMAPLGLYSVQNFFPLFTKKLGLGGLGLETFYEERNSTSLFEDDDDLITYDQVLVYEFVYQFFQECAYLEYYLLSMMHIIDIRVMICQPFDYAKFSENKQVLIRLAIGTSVCFILSCDCLIDIFYRLYYHGAMKIRTDESPENIILASFIIKVIKLTTIKISYGVANIKMFLNIRHSLSESTKMNQNSEREKSHRNLQNFILVPFFLNILFLGHDVPKVIGLIKKKFVKNCESLLLRPEFVQGLPAAVFTLGSYAYNIAYLVFFPKLRKALFCRETNE